MCSGTKGPTQLCVSAGLDCNEVSEAFLFGDAGLFGETRLCVLGELERICIYIWYMPKTFVCSKSPLFQDFERIRYVFAILSGCNLVLYTVKTNKLTSMSLYMFLTAPFSLFFFF